MSLVAFQKSLLKGTSNHPFPNLACISAEAFEQLPLLEQFLINETTATYGFSLLLSNEKPQVLPEEKYPIGPATIANAFLALPEKVRDYAIEPLIRYHTKNKLVFHPSLLIAALSNKEVWSEYIIDLPFVMRGRARWLAHNNSDWQWYDEALTADIWQSMQNPNRFLYFMLLRKVDPEKAALILGQSYFNEKAETVAFLIEIIATELNEKDLPLFNQMLIHGSHDDREIARNFLVTLPTHPFYIQLNSLAQQCDFVINKMIEQDFYMTDLLNQFYPDGRNQFPIHLLMAGAYDRYKWFDGKEYKKLIFYVATQKRHNYIANQLLRVYLTRRDFISFARAYADINETEMDFAMDRVNANILLRLDDGSFELAWSAMMQHGSNGARWHFVHAVFSMGNRQVTYLMSQNLVQLFKLYQGVYTHSSILNSSEPVFSNVLLSVDKEPATSFIAWINNMYGLFRTNIHKKSGYPYMAQKLFEFKWSYYQ